jgi:hypothetical protein
LQRDLEAAIFEQRAERGAVRPLPSELTTPPVTNMNFISNYFARMDTDSHIKLHFIFRC